MRRAGQTWLGKAVIAVLFGFLIVSFAIWGINDIFRGAPQNTVASVGKRDISSEAFRTAYQADLQYLMRQTRQSITPERARALGLDRRVLSRLVTEATLDQNAAALGLGVSENLVASSILEDPNFRGPDGRFNRALFEDALRDRGMRESDFVREQRAALARSLIAEAVMGGVQAPLAAREAFHRYGAERRSASVITLPPSLAGEVGAPTDEQLNAFFESRKGTFRAPEYRGLNALAVNVAGLAKPDAVSDEEARRRYESVRGTRFGAPERRTVEQIVFPSAAEAEAASERIKGGATLEAIAAERKIDPKDLVLGTFAKDQMVDPAIAEAAFKLPQGAVSEPIQGRFGPAIIRVTKVEPESVRPFQEVAAEVKREIALERARAELDALHGAIEDLRAGARPLPEIAREKDLPLVNVPATDRSGLDKAGRRIEALPEREALLEAVFKSDIGVDNEALRTRDGGYVWFEVTGIEPARDRTLAEVRDQVVAQWREEEVARRLAERARSIVERLEKGEAAEALAAELGLTARTVAELARGAAKDNLPADVIARLFAVPVGKAGSAPSGDSRIVYKVTDATVPPFVTSTREAASIDDQLRSLIGNDLLAQYIAQLQKEIPVSVNEQALRRTVGGEL